jgi:hypothetical protein
MKVRITHDTIRIRLNQTEVRQLGDGHRVEMETPFAGGAKLHSVLQPVDTTTFAASLQPFALVIDVPRSQLSDWVYSDAVTLESHPPAGGGATVLIEKDFHCLHRNTADDADTFPNPKLR